MSDKVTWLIPVKNGMPYLPETLASIEAQTYRDWEVLVWDNGSTDGTVAELHKWIPSRLPGRVIDDRPLTLGKARAMLVEMARTELCACVDADDINYPTRLEQQVGFMRGRPEVGVVGAQVEFIDEHGRTQPGAWVQPHGDAEIRWMLRWANPFNQPAVMFRRSAVLAAGNYSACLVEDYDLWYRMGLITETANLPDVLVKYRRLMTGYTGMCATLTGSKSPLPLFDLVAEQNAGALFPGMAGEAALKFRRKFVEGSGEQVSLADLAALWKIAAKAALAVGKPPAYFRSTKLFSRQRRELLRRWLMQQPLGRTIFTTKRKIQSRLAS
jgi:glycosyltransferase involved in cell wall biosynthesis